MRPAFWIFLLFSFLGLKSPASARAESPAALFKKANAAYRNGDYTAATSGYESLIMRNWKNANVYYNLGNVYFKEKRLGQAILNYEKARRQDPRDRDISANLAYVRGLLEYRVEDKRNWYLKAGEAILASFTSREIGIVSLLLGLLFWISWGISLYLHPNSAWGWKRKALLGVTLVCVSLWVLRGWHDVTFEEAIAIKPQAAVRYGPSPKDQVAFRLGEGIKVRIKNRQGEWSRVVLANGETGWMNQEDVGIV